MTIPSAQCCYFDNLHLYQAPLADIFPSISQERGGIIPCGALAERGYTRSRLSPTSLGLTHILGPGSPDTNR
jgi:hypothetical protein